MNTQTKIIQIGEKFNLNIHFKDRTKIIIYFNLKIKIKENNNLLYLLIKMIIK